MYHILLIFQIRKSRLQEVVGSCQGHSSIKQKSQDSPKQWTSISSAPNCSFVLQTLCKWLLLMLMLKLWIAAAPAVCDHPPQHHRDEVPCESLCKECRLVKYPKQFQLSGKIQNWLILRMDGGRCHNRWMHSRPFQVEDQKVGPLPTFLQPSFQEDVLKERPC